MTYCDVLIQILHEVTGKSKQGLSAVFDLFKATAPEDTKLDEELSAEKAEELLAGFRKEPSGVLAWYVKTGMKAYLESVDPKGHA